MITWSDIMWVTPKMIGATASAGAAAGYRAQVSRPLARSSLLCVEFFFDAGCLTSRPFRALCCVDGRRDVIPDETAVDSFTRLVKESEPRLRHALSAAFGLEVGREATAEALAYGWEHWDRLRSMENPAGYLYKVGQTRGRRLGRRPVVFPQVDSQHWPWVEPALPDALRSLSEKQRTVIVLLHSFGWTYAGVAELLQISRGSVQRYEERALRKLRAALGVTSDA